MSLIFAKTLILKVGLERKLRGLPIHAGLVEWRENTISKDGE